MLFCKLFEMFSGRTYMSVWSMSHTLYIKMTTSNGYTLSSTPCQERESILVVVGTACVGEC